MSGQEILGADAWSCFQWKEIRLSLLQRPGCLEQYQHDSHDR